MPGRRRRTRRGRMQEIVRAVSMPGIAGQTRERSHLTQCACCRPCPALAAVYDACAAPRTRAVSARSGPRQRHGAALDTDTARPSTQTRRGPRGAVRVVKAPSRTSRPHLLQRAKPRRIQGDVSQPHQPHHAHHARREPPAPRRHMPTDTRRPHPRGRRGRAA